MSADDPTRAIRDKVIAAISRHRSAYGGPALSALGDSSVLRTIVEALDEEREAREAAVKAERKRVAREAEAVLARWRELLPEIDRLDASTALGVTSRIGADVEARGRAAVASDADWIAAMTVAMRSWWTALTERPAASRNLIAGQLTRALAALAKDG